MALGVEADGGAVQIVAVMKDPSALPCEPQQPLQALGEGDSAHSDGGAQGSHAAAPTAGTDTGEDGQRSEDPTADWSADGGFVDLSCNALKSGQSEIEGRRSVDGAGLEFHAGALPWEHPGAEFAEPEESMRECWVLWVGSLPPRCSELQLLEAFAPYGPIASVHVKSQQQSGLYSSLGFVNFLDDSAARAAFEDMWEAVIDGYTIKLREPQPKMLLWYFPRFLALVLSLLSARCCSGTAEMPFYLTWCLARAATPTR